jgi:hypothetical protein
MHHVYSRKAFFEYKDKDWNKAPLCFLCHTECHTRGNQEFAKRNKGFADWLKENGWIVFNGKLINRNMYE